MYLLLRWSFQCLCLFGSASVGRTNGSWIVLNPLRHECCSARLMKPECSNHGSHVSLKTYSSWPCCAPHTHPPSKSPVSWPIVPSLPPTVLGGVLMWFHFPNGNTNMNWQHGRHFPTSFTPYDTCNYFFYLFGLVGNVETFTHWFTATETCSRLSVEKLLFRCTVVSDANSTYEATPMFPEFIRGTNTACSLSHWSCTIRLSE